MGILALLMILSSCSSTAKFQQVRGGYLYSKKNILYVPAPDCYRSTGYYEDDLVGTYTSPGGTVKNFYLLSELEGAITDNDYYVYLPEEQSLPSFGDLTLTGAQLCLSDALTVPVVSYSVTEAEVLRNAVLNGSPFPHGRINVKVQSRYDLIFSIADYPLTYQLIYQEFSESILLYEPLTESGDIPDLYPGVPAVKQTLEGEEIAVFDFGTQILYDRTGGNCYSVRDLTTD